jgi:hypothetical protein
MEFGFTATPAIADETPQLVEAGTRGPGGPDAPTGVSRSSENWPLRSAQIARVS